MKDVHLLSLGFLYIFVLGTIISMKQKLIILSDLWGKKKSDWVNNYTELLSPIFNVVFYDSCDLGEIDVTDYSEKAIHEQFINGGIDTAVTNLLEKEKEEITVLAFSFGGSIAWKAGLKGLNIVNFFAVSSSRLRYEIIKPNCAIHLWFGGLDNYRPALNWFKKLSITEFTILKNDGHNLYTSSECILSLCNKIITHPPATF